MSNFLSLIFFFFNDPPTTEIYTPLYTLSLHDALPIYVNPRRCLAAAGHRYPVERRGIRSEEHTSELQSHSGISYAVFCLKKKTKRGRNSRATAQVPTKTATYDRWAA